MTDPFSTATACDGSSECAASLHIHGCFSDDGSNCDDAHSADHLHTAYGCALHGEAFTPGCPGCEDYADDLAIADEVRERDASDTGERITIEELVRDADI